MITQIKLIRETVSLKTIYSKLFISIDKVLEHYCRMKEDAFSSRVVQVVEGVRLGQGFSCVP